MELETAKKSLKTKLTLLQLNVKRTVSILQGQQHDAIERHYKALKAVVTAVDESRRAVEEQKIIAEESLEDINKWNEEINAKFTQADEEVKRIKDWLDSRKRDEETRLREEQIKHETKLHETRMKFQTELKMAQKNEESDAGIKTSYVSETTGIQARLPKLEIAEFDGSYMDWLRFWGQFEEIVDKTNMTATSKLAYLRGLLCKKVRKSIEALPFTAEGYNRAKSILKSAYGKESEVIKAYTKEIMSLPHIPNVNLKRIHEFSEKLLYCVQSLQTLGKLHQVEGNVAMTLDELPAIRGDLVRTDPDWEIWVYGKLAEALRQWTRRNPIDDKTAEEPEYKRRERSGKLYQARQNKGCVYCDDVNHKSGGCTKVTSTSERRQILAKRHLCFNCTGASHRAADCPSKSKCLNCEKRHHTSICDDQKVEKPKKLLSASVTGEGLFPVVLVKVNGITVRALIDSGAGSSYASAKLIDTLNLKPCEVKTKRVDMLMGSCVERFETYETVMTSTDDKYQMDVRLTKVHKDKLLAIDNPNYDAIIARYSHLSDVKISDDDKKASLPVHVVLSGGEYARIKTETKPQVGKDGEPVAEYTKLGWFIMSPGDEFDRSTMLLTQTSQTDYEKLCRLDILGLADAPVNDQEMVYSEFKEQLTRGPEGWYETGLPWRGNHANLPNNKQGSLRRLSHLTKRLQRDGLTTEYDSIIREQLNEGIVERAREVPSTKEFYIPHKAVVKESAESTKTRIVYDASAKASADVPSLNECLNPGPSLQNKLWDVLVQQRAYPVVVTADIRKAFLPIRIRESERDSLRFHWQKEPLSEIEVLRFTRALFGLISSPFLLAGVLECHFDAWAKKYPDFIKELRRSLYVDDLLTGGKTVLEARVRKEKSNEVLNVATFQLHKWHSNVEELERDGDGAGSNEEQSFAKQQFGVQPSETRMLGLKWNKVEDILTINFPQDDHPLLDTYICYYNK